MKIPALQGAERAEQDGGVMLGHCLEKRRLWSDLSGGFWYLKGADRRAGEELLTRGGRNRARGNDSS